MDLKRSSNERCILMRLEGLMKPLLQDNKFKNIVKNIHKNEFPIDVTGVSESGRAYFIKGIYDNIDKPIFIFTNSDVEAKNLYEDLSLYIPNVYYLPNKEVVFYNVYAISGDLRWERLKVIREMLKKDRKIVVASIETLASTYISPKLYKEYTINISKGDILDIEELSEKLIQSGYQRTNIVEGKGEFSVRGGILDIYSPISSIPFRIELFGDEVDSIRSFNTESQRSIKKYKTMEIFPAKELILTKESIDKGYSSIRDDLEKVKVSLLDDEETLEKIQKDTLDNLESRSEERRVGKECRSRWSPYH